MEKETPHAMLPNYPIILTSSDTKCNLFDNCVMCSPSRNADMLKGRKRKRQKIKRNMDMMIKGIFNLWRVRGLQRSSPH